MLLGSPVIRMCCCLCEQRILWGEAQLELGKKEDSVPCLVRGKILQSLMLILSVDGLL